MSWFSNIPSYISSQDVDEEGNGGHDGDEGSGTEASLSSDLEDEEGENSKHSWSYKPSELDVNESTFKSKGDNQSKQGSSIAMLEPACTITLQDSMRATCSQFSPDGRWIAVGLTSGFIQVRSVLDGSLAVLLDPLKGVKKKRWPCTCMCVRPCKPGESSYNVLLSCDLSGRIHYWHMTSGMHLGITEEEENCIFAIDFHDKGFKYATGGSDCKKTMVDCFCTCTCEKGFLEAIGQIRVYDAATRNLLANLSEGNGRSTSGHSNRVFAVKIYPLHDNIVLSGGWDNTVQIWDLRVRHSVRSIWGPKICGEALDVNATGNLILTGSWRTCNQLQEWDFGTGKVVHNIPWIPDSEHPCRVYTAKYGRGFSSKMMFAGGSTSNEACVFCEENSQVIASLGKINGVIYSMALSSDGKLWSVTSPCATRIVNLDQFSVLKCVDVNSKYK